MNLREQVQQQWTGLKEKIKKTNSSAYSDLIEEFEDNKVLVVVSESMNQTDLSFEIRKQVDPHVRTFFLNKDGSVIEEMD